jgi:hypothetical protein
MPGATYFVQECPTCGRRLQIRVDYLGKRVVCQHCQGTFAAADKSAARDELDDHGSVLLRRANELLESVALRQSAVTHSAASPPAIH